jgi:hypothetical protein
MKKIALCHDFDGTLCSDMQDQKLLHDCKIEPKDFWFKVANYARENNVDTVMDKRKVLDYKI